MARRDMLSLLGECARDLADELRRLGGSRRDADSTGLEHLLLRLRRPGRARDDRPRVTHGLPDRGGEPGDVANDGLRHVRLDEARRLLLLVAADLADHHDDLGLGISLEALE